MRSKLIIGATVLTAAAVVATQVQAADIQVPTNLGTNSNSSDLNWEGFYVGGKLGWGGGYEHDNLRPTASTGTSTTPTSSPVVADNFHLGGIVGGIYAGHNWQSNNVVIGIEGELDGLDLTGSHSFSTNGVTGTLSMKSNFQGFAKVRAGYLVNSALFYLTAGVGFANATLRATGSGAFSGINASDSGVSPGAMIGAGIEYALDNKWSLRGEVDYARFGSHTYNLGSTYNPTVASWEQTTFTIGASYRF